MDAEPQASPTLAGQTETSAMVTRMRSGTRVHLNALRVCV
jgi:hypothetical protein